MKEIDRKRRLDVVVVEDDPEQCEALGAILVRAGHRVRTCPAVDEALELVRQQRPQVLLTDLALHDESGADLGRRLRAHPATALIAQIAMTGSVDPDWETVRHFDLYLRKPIAEKELLQLLEQLAISVEDAHLLR